MKTRKHLLFIFTLCFSLNSFSQDKIDLLILNKNYEEALLQINSQIEINPSAKLYFKKGIVNQSLQNYQEAIFAFSKAQQYDPKNVEILNEMAESLSAIGNYHDAVNYFQQAVQLEPSNLSLAAKLGRSLINLKQYKSAFDVFSAIYKKDSTNLYWNKQLAFCSFRTAKKVQAIHLYEKVLEQNPRDYSTYFNLSRLYSRKKEPEKIVNLLENGLNEFPGDAGFYLEFANYYFGSKQYDLAMPEFENYFSAGGDSLFKTNLNYAISCYFAKDETKALKVLSSLYHLSPNDPFVLFYMSLCNKKMVNYELAESFMEGAIDMSIPEYLSEMYHHLGQIHGQQREFVESIAALVKSNELNPTNHEVLFEIATTYEEYNSNKTLALNYYLIYLKEAGESGKNTNYALDRITKIKEDLFFEE
ncbi:MAG: tetratricopeptide repeat protein [Prolixibacteraceae bacterium]|nr:tetratricopeptide repeat protein [Prolixibacteraceae bacterium]MBT6766064.1 tetratricopeptide repeat protein [Prolixibacteraceae bacterium]MBT7000710.1 tetratricopeptide repeat protein [Prolixibacteraceae bacterium]MBT7395298.1 tetratricopeptide repeat protein [Prolixibacteraceae bacterium]